MAKNKLRYTLVSDGENETLTVYREGDTMPHVAHSNHPKYQQIKEGIQKGDESVLKFVDITRAIKEEFEKLSERVSVGNGRIYFDGDEVDNSCTRQILRFIEEDRTDLRPLVLFFEKVMTNPQKHSREQLHEFLRRRDFTIHEDGDIIAYKSVNKVPDEREYASVTQGPATVNGKKYEGKNHVPNPIGATVEMSRGEIDSNPTVACSHGLHVGAYSYAKGFSGNTILEVKVNPRDVVSVPKDNDWAKVRTCRYTILGVATAPRKSAVRLKGDAPVRAAA